MKVVELQDVRIWRIHDRDYTEDMIIIMEDGELVFYQVLPEKYSIFERALAKEKEK